MEFKKYNKNPKQWKHEGDCVVRAISTAMNQTWDETYMELCYLGRKKCMMPNSKKLYEAYLKQMGWEKHKMPRHLDRSRYTVAEIIDENKNRTMIISMANHLTCAVDGTLIDTWDCRNKSVGNYWTNSDYDKVISLEEMNEVVRRIL